VRSFQGMIALAIVAAPFVALAEPEPVTDAGLYAGTFLSNFYHRFYDSSKWTAATRPNISRVSPQFGARYAYWVWPRLGFEGDGSIAIAGIDGKSDNAQLYGLRLQAIAQYPIGGWAPFVTLGGGILHESSNTLGTATAGMVHAGGGVRYYITPTVALRLDGRFIRGPSSAHGELGASYGEVALGVSWAPGAAADHAAAAIEDPDPDHDGVLGRSDACPNEPGGGSSDGCPARDKDGDGIPDRADACPELAETINGYQDEDGCPDQVPDSDHDGIVDPKDRCPQQAEDKDGFEDDDGCPDPDNDGDGVLDAADRCPLLKGPAENHGCPELDSDRDGVPDRLDNCPAEVGLDHGCKAPQKVWISGTTLTATVRFARPGATLGEPAKRALDDAAVIINAHPAWQVQVVAHAPTRAGAEARARSVVKYLAGRGVAANHLQAVGRDDAKSAEVELHIVSE
jgi:hypothetical protein